jgi:polysaccharide biosynthesis transport protein
MSRNFEVLQRAEIDYEWAPTFTRPARPEARSAHLDIDALGREEAVKLVRRVFLLGEKSAPKIVVFSGVERSVGCSWICAYVARILATQTNASVCAVDADWQAPSLGRYFDLDGGEPAFMGRPQMPLDRAVSIKSTNLWALPCAPSRSAPSSLMSMTALKARLAEFRSQFGFILIDSPPVNLSADAITLGQMADGVILVIESSMTRREAARRAKQNLESSQVALLGVVLNKRTYPVPELVYRMLR